MTASEKNALRTEKSLFSSLTPKEVIASKDAQQKVKKAKTSPSSLLKVDTTPIDLLVDNEAWVHGKDPFRAYSQNPAEACALESSLLELASLTNHYCPDVSRLAKLFFAENAPKHGHELAEFTDVAYSTLFSAAAEFRKNRMTAMEFEKPKSLFGKSEDSRKILDQAAAAEKAMILDDSDFEGDDDDDEDVKEMRAMMKASGQGIADASVSSLGEDTSAETVFEVLFSL